MLRVIHQTALHTMSFNCVFKKYTKKEIFLQNVQGEQRLQCFIFKRRVLSESRLEAQGNTDVLSPSFPHCLNMLLL